MVQSKTQDLEKARTWRTLIREASRSGLSIREFCRRQGLKERQFYIRQRRLKEGRAEKLTGHGQATFALVSEDELEAGIELVLRSGVRIRIGRGVDEATLRTVLATADRELGSKSCIGTGTAGRSGTSGWRRGRLSFPSPRRAVGSFRPGSWGFCSKASTWSGAGGGSGTVCPKKPENIFEKTHFSLDNNRYFM